MKRLIFVLLLIQITIFSSFSQDQTFDFGSKKTLTLAFGSCNRQNLEQPLWEPIIDHQPDLFMFLGDNIYGDTDDMEVLTEKYTIQKSQADYRKLIQKVPVIGVWDDHDYGKNDAGKEYQFKEASQERFLNFFDVPKDDIRRERKGVYSSYDLKWNSSTIRVILLDTRYHRDELERINRVYQENTSGSILGESQWKWLGNELSDETIDFFIVASGIQFISEEHDYEKWANFPQERQKLLDLIQKNQAKGTVLLSGDRHIAEMSQVQLDHLKYPLLDVTSSGLTHTWKDEPNEANKHRIGKMMNQLNYGLIKIEKVETGLKVIYEIRGRNQDLFQAFGMIY